MTDCRFGQSQKGLQIGGTETDVFMLVMNEKGRDRLLSTKFTLGGDATAAAGPVGRSAQAETDAANDIVAGVRDIQRAA